MCAATTEEQAHEYARELQGLLVWMWSGGQVRHTDRWAEGADQVISFCEHRPTRLKGRFSEGGEAIHVHIKGSLTIPKTLILKGILWEC